MKIEVDVNKESWKDKIKNAWSKFKTWCHNRAEDVKRWTEDHWYDVLKAIPLLLSATAGGIKVYKMLKGSAADRHEDRMSKTYYDPSTGLHWDLRRNMTNDERIELMQRKREGEFTEEILKDMRILRR